MSIPTEERVVRTNRIHPFSCAPLPALGSARGRYSVRPV